MKCEYCKKFKEDVKLRTPKLTGSKLNLCDICFKLSDTEDFYDTFKEKK